LLPTLAGSMEQVCVCVRVLLWRWLGKRCHMSYRYIAIPQFRELSDCPTYTRTMGTGYFRGYSGRCVVLNTHRHLALRLKKGYSCTYSPPMDLSCLV
jgi:hypothetical protein